MINWPEKKPCHFSCPDEDGYYCTFCIINATIDACIEAYEKGRLSVEEIDHMLTEHVFIGKIKTKDGFDLIMDVSVRKAIAKAIYEAEKG